MEADGRIRDFSVNRTEAGRIKPGSRLTITAAGSAPLVYEWDGRQWVGPAQSHTASA